MWLFRRRRVSEELLRLIHEDVHSLRREVRIMSLTQAQVETKLDELTARNDKAFAEQSKALQDLKDQLAAAGNSTPGVDNALARLEASIQRDDDQNPDEETEEGSQPA